MKTPMSESASLLKQRFWHWYFPVKFFDISKNTFFIEHVWATASVKLNPLVAGVN